MLASWVQKGFMCFEASLPGLKTTAGGLGGGGGRSPPPPICKHNARIMGLEGVHTL